MSGFSLEWLSLRESADAAARDAGITRFVIDAIARGREISVVDLGAGSGSNIRFLAPRFGPRRPRWQAVDHDPELLSRARSSAPQVRTVQSDLADIDRSWFDAVDLVTASALLDLVSEEWLIRLVDRCRDARACVLFALNYDGRIACTPVDDDDHLVVDLVNQHQRTDKGFGPALGPAAGATAAQLLAAAGYDVRRAPSDWSLDGRHARLQQQLIAGWAQAACEVDAEAARRIREWEQRRLALLDAGRSRLLVGHDDVGGVIR
jgi:SAM-dependent methyltransferase